MLIGFTVDCTEFYNNVHIQEVFRIDADSRLRGAKNERNARRPLLRRLSR